MLFVSSQKSLKIFLFENILFLLHNFKSYVYFLDITDSIFDTLIGLLIATVQVTSPW